MRLEDVSKKHLTDAEFTCPNKGTRINFPVSLIECRVQIVNGKFANAQLGVQCAACGEFHLTDLIPMGFLVIRGSNTGNWPEVIAESGTNAAK